MAKIVKKQKTNSCPNCLLSKGQRCSPCYQRKYSKHYYLKQILTDPNYNRKNYQKRKLKIG